METQWVRRAARLGRLQTEFKWSRLAERADLIAVNCQGCITGLLLSLLSPRRFIPFDARLKFCPDIAVTQRAYAVPRQYTFLAHVIPGNARTK